MIDSHSLLAILLALLQDFVDALSTADACEEIASRFQVGINLQGFGEMLLCSWNIFSLKVHIGHLILGHCGGFALRHLSECSVWITGIEKSACKSVAIGFIRRL